MSKLLHFCFVSAGCLAAFPALADDATQAALHVNPGLWELVLTPKISGEMPVPQSVLDRLPPERRAKIQAALQAIMSKQIPRKYKECMTKEQLAKGFQIDKDEPSCKRTVVSNTASVMEVRETCASNGGTRSAHFRFEADGSDKMTGVVDIDVARGGKSMTLHNTIAGRWLGADCGAVKTIQAEH